MNPFPIEDDFLPPPPISPYHRVIAAHDALTHAHRHAPWLAPRSHEDTLVDAKAVDERVRTGEALPLAGVLVAVPDTPPLPQRLLAAGAIVLGTVDARLPGDAATLDIVDAVVAASPPTRGGNRVALTPTSGLVPAMDTVTVVADDIDVAQRTAAAMTGPVGGDPLSRGWPEWTRLGAGEHPRIVVPDERDLAGFAARDRKGLDATVDTLRATTATVDAAPLREIAERWAQRPVTALGEHDALLLPAARTTPAFAELVAALDASAVVLPDAGAFGIGVLTPAFHDQVAIDIAALLTGVQADTPYPTVGGDLVVFGAYLRGQPRHGDLARTGARFADFAWTAPHYRMVALPGSPPQAGVVDADGGAALLGERWLVSPAGLSDFLADLPAPMTLGPVELEGGTTATGVLCDPTAAARGTDVTAFGCWRAYLRHLSTQRPVARPAAS